MAKALFCKECGARLSERVTIRSGKDPAAPKLQYADKEPLTERGIAYKSYEPQMRSGTSKPDPLEFVPQIWMNPGDLTAGVRDTKRSERLGGCCGLAGMGGPNQVCACGAEVGTLRSDCWTAHVFIPEPGTTEWAEAGDEPEQGGT
jgi:hypothetical protein